MPDYPKSPGLKRPPKALLNKSYSSIPRDRTVRFFLERNWSLAVLCRDCDRLAEITPPELADIFVGKLETRIMDLPGRLTCKPPEGCGSKHVLIYPHHYEHEWDWEGG